MRTHRLPFDAELEEPDVSGLQDLEILLGVGLATQASAPNSTVSTEKPGGA